MDVLDILPEEMWECVISKLDTCEDKLSAYNTCRLWRSFLVKDRTEWMLEGIFPLLSEHLELFDILNCRQVCKSWSSAIDSSLQAEQSIFNNTIPNHFVSYDNCLTSSCGANIKKTENTTLEEALTRFHTDFSPPGVSTIKNPFISRSLDITLEIHAVDLKVVELFFEKFGAHLHDLTLYIFHFDPEEISTVIQLLKVVWNLLRHTPNLKQLDVVTWVLSYDSDYPGSRKKQKAQQRKLKMFLGRHSAPPLPQLQSIALTGNYDPINQVLETAYGSQRTICVYHVLEDPVLSNLTNLKQFAWNFYSLNCAKELGHLKNLECPKLQQLGIYVNAFGMSENENSSPFSQQLFEAIERFRSSLTHLEIIWTVLEPNFPAQLNMPLVQELSLKIAKCENPENLNLSFLQGFKSLRKLKCVFSECSYTHFVEMRKKESLIPAAEEAVDLHYYLQDDMNAGPYKSNIWRLLPSLGMITIQLVRIVRDPSWVTPTIFTKTYTRYEMNKK